MANIYNTDLSQTIPVVYHKVGERVVVLINGSQAEAPKLTIRSLSTGRYFNKQTKEFEDYSETSNTAGYYTFTFNQLYDMGIYNVSVSTLPSERQQLLFEYKSVSFSDDGDSATTSAIDEASAEVVSEPFFVPSAGNYDVEFTLSAGSTDTVFAEVVVNGSDFANTAVSLTKNSTSKTYSFPLNGLFASDEIEIKAWSIPFDEGATAYDQATVSNVKVYSNSYERHVFGGEVNASESQTCTIYGTLLDVSGRPMIGQKVEVYLNRAGYFTHKAGLVGYAATALTDDAGYWELPIIVGLDVTINVPIIGFSQSGFVPPLSSVELTPDTLLKYKN